MLARTELRGPMAVCVGTVDHVLRPDPHGGLGAIRVLAVELIDGLLGPAAKALFRRSLLASASEGSLVGEAIDGTRESVGLADL